MMEDLYKKLQAEPLYHHSMKLLSEDERSSVEAYCKSYFSEMSTLLELIRQSLAAQSEDGLVIDDTVTDGSNG